MPNTSEQQRQSVEQVVKAENAFILWEKGIYMQYLASNKRKFCEEIEFTHHTFIQLTYERPSAINGRDHEYGSLS